MQPISIQNAQPPMHNFHLMQQNTSPHFGFTQPAQSSSYGQPGSFYTMLNGSFQNPDQQYIQASDNMYGQLNTALAGSQGNISIFTESPSPKDSLFNGFSSHEATTTSKHLTATAMTEAMEKLSDSMRRTAMTRSIVKQLSNQSLVRHTSSKGLMGRQASFRGMIGGKQLSIRNLASQASDRSLTGGEAGRTPVRRLSSSAKHHLHHHGHRGVFRHEDSQRSLNGHSNHGIHLQIDGRNVGTF